MMFVASTGSIAQLSDSAEYGLGAVVVHLGRWADQGEGAGAAAA
jgi:hypothetical protein